MYILLSAFLGGTIGFSRDFTNIKYNAARGLLFPLPESVRRFISSVGFSSKSGPIVLSILERVSSLYSID